MSKRTMWVGITFFPLVQVFLTLTQAGTVFAKIIHQGDILIPFSTQQSVAPSHNTKAYTMVSGKNERMAGSVPVKETSFAENIAQLNEKDEPHIWPDEPNRFGIADIVDMINPLQHIPIVNNVYQSVTGDTIGSIAMIVGGAVFGGPIGALTSMGFAAYRAAKNDMAQQLQSQSDPQAFPSPEDVFVADADSRPGFKPYNT